MKRVLALVLLCASCAGAQIFPLGRPPSAIGGGGSPPAFVSSTYVAETGAGPFASITSPALTLTSGQMVDVYCRNGTSTANAFTYTSSPSNTWIAIAAQQMSGGFGNGQMGYAFNVGSGSTTFTCTPATSAGYMSMIVLVYSQSPIFSVLNATTGTGGGPGSATYTSPSFTTTQAGVIVMCATASAAGDTWTAGTIAGQAATIRQVSNTGGVGATADAVCEDVITTSAQAGVTGTVIHSTTARNYALTVGAFN